jgi:hypothetical protein
MTPENNSRLEPSNRLYRVVEQIASAVLLLVLAALGWIIIAASSPAWGRLASLELEVIGIVALLLAALMLVSVVALMHTRKSQGND